MKTGQVLLFTQILDASSSWEDLKWLEEGCKYVQVGIYRRSCMQNPEKDRNGKGRPSHRKTNEQGVLQNNGDFE